MLAHRTIVCLLALFVGGAFAGEPNPPDKGDTDAKTKEITSRYYADLAQVHLKYKVYDQAEECFKRAIEMEQSSGVISDYAYQLARLYNDWGRHDQAEAMFEFCLELTPDTSSIVNRSRELARFYEGKGYYDKAEAVYRKALEKADGPLARLLKQEWLRACSKTGKLEQIIAEKEKESAADPMNTDLLADLGHAYRLGRDHEKEEEAYRRILEIDPKNQKVLSQLANAQRSAGRTDEAIKTYEQLIKTNPAARSHYIAEIIKLYVRSGKTQEAQAWENRLVSREGRDAPSARARLGRLYHGLKIYDKAIEHYLAAVEAAQAPRQKQQYRIHLARAYLAADKPAQAEEVCEQVVDNSSRPAFRREAQALLARIRRERAKEQDATKPREQE